MVFCLFIITTLTTYMAYRLSRLKLLSPTFWASGMFMFFSFIYSITIYNMKSDISIKTLCAIIGFLAVTAGGEYVGNHLRLGHRLKNLSSSNGVDDLVEIHVDKWKPIMLFMIYMIVAIDRYKNVAIFARSYGGGFSGIMQMLSYARLAFVDVNGSVVLGNFFFNQLIYVCEITAYIMIFIFLHNLICCKKRQWYLLLPLIPDLIIRFLSTSRTSFMILLIAIMVGYFCILWKQKVLKKIHISPKLVIGVGVFAIGFLVYGRIRNEAQSIPVISYIQMYTCSSLYGLHDLLENGWDKTPYFGYNTLQHIYNMLQSSHDNIKTWNDMLFFSKDNFHSNVYTSLYDVIIDYGIPGMLILRFITAFISAKIISVFVNTDYSQYKFYYLLFFVIACIYCYFYSATGDVFMDYFLNPMLMIRYLIYGWALVRFFLQPKTYIQLD